LKSSIRDHNPVLFVESGLLYRTKGPVPEEEYTTPLGEAAVKKKGDDITIVAVSRMVNESLAAAKKLEDGGIAAEVIDVRTIQPIDLDTIAESVKRTSRLVIASDDVKRGGIGAEISASIIETCFDYLDAPITRVACPDTPIPFSPQLEQQYMPNADRVVQAVQTAMGR
jgi:pyruvate dehydrogenase E1 component beta subunit